jgi:hypothetical protein
LKKKTLENKTLEKKTLEKKTLEKKTLEKKTFENKTFENKTLEKKGRNADSYGWIIFGPFIAVLRIHDILGWIRIRGSMPLTNGSGFGSGSWIRILLFSSLTFRMPAKNKFFTQFFMLITF